MKQSEKTKITNERIINAAIAEFGINGYSAASLNSICASGIPKGLIYHNFTSKDELYLCCVEKAFNDITGYLSSAAINNDLKEYMQVRFNFFYEHKNEAHIFFEAVLQPPKLLADKIIALRKGFDKVNSDIYKKIISSVKLRDGVTFDTAIEYFSIQQTMFNSYFLNNDFSNYSLEDKMSVHESFLSVFLDFMIYGIAEREDNI